MVQATTRQDVIAQVEMQVGVALTPDARTLLAASRFDRRLEDGLLALLKETYSRQSPLTWGNSGTPPRAASGRGSRHG